MASTVAGYLRSDAAHRKNSLAASRLLSFNLSRFASVPFGEIFDFVSLVLVLVLLFLVRA